MRKSTYALERLFRKSEDGIRSCDNMASLKNINAGDAVTLRLNCTLIVYRRVLILLSRPWTHFSTMNFLQRLMLRSAGIRRLSTPIPYAQSHDNVLNIIIVLFLVLYCGGLSSGPESSWDEFEERSRDISGISLRSDACESRKYCRVVVFCTTCRHKLELVERMG